MSHAETRDTVESPWKHQKPSTGSDGEFVSPNFATGIFDKSSRISVWVKPITTP